MADTRPHPAKFSDLVLEYARDMAAAHGLLDTRNVLDPFAGVGRVFEVFPQAVGVEIEEGWANADKRIRLGNSLHLKKLFPRKRFGLVFTSPCLAQDHRILTDDLRWVPVGDVEEGDRIIAFDEFSPGLKANGHAYRRRWARGEVVRSIPQTQPCLRVILENGEEIITTKEHPWLAQPYAYGGGVDWVASEDLMSLSDPHVMKQLDPWTERNTFDAGWLSGMFDGEGSLSLGGHGAPKMAMYQALGPVADHAVELMTEYGYKPNSIIRKETATRPDVQTIVNIYVTGGFPGMMKALGELRPIRLLDKWTGLDISTRTIQPQPVRVVAVEDAGMRDIQVIETTTGTYIGEGYLHHNCYANRMADHHNNQDPCKKCNGSGKLMKDEGLCGMQWVNCSACKGSGLSRRHTYFHYYGEELNPESSATLPWGEPYREFHRQAWASVRDVMEGGGYFMLNVSDHIRLHRRMPVEKFHIRTLQDLGFTEVDRVRVPTPRQRHGKNYQVRVATEGLFLFRLTSS